MSPTQATAEVFFTAFRSLPRNERDAVLNRIVRNRSTRRDLLDLALVEERRHERSRPFREFLAKKRSR